MGLTDLLLNRESRTAPAAPEVRDGGLTTLLANAGGYAAEVDNGKWWGGDDERGLSTSAVVRRCVNAIAQPLASLDLTVLNGDGEEQPHPFSEVFNKGAADSPMSARMTKETAFARLEWRGQSFLFMDRGDSGAGPVRSVVPIYRACKPVVDRDNRGQERLIGYKVRTPAGGWIGLLPSEVLWLRYPDPDDPWGCVAPWSGAKWAARLDRMAQGWQEEELRNGNRAAAVVYLGDLSEHEHEKAVVSWNRQMNGPRSANRAFLTSGPTAAKVDRLGMTAKEAAYLDTRKVNAEEVALAFGIDRDYLFGESKYENKAAAKRALWSDTLIPKLEVVSSEVDRQVIPEPGISAAWDVSEVEALQENEDAKVTRLTDLLDHDAMTLDEVRSDRGLEPLTNGLGHLTITEYRARVQSGASTPAPDPAADPAALRVKARERRYITRGGLRTIAARTGAQRALTAPPATRTAAARDEAAIQRAYDRLEARGVKAVTRLADQMERAVLRNFKKAAERASAGTTEVRVTASEFFDPNFWQGKTKDALEVWLADVWDEGGQRTASHLGLSFDLYDARVNEYMLRRLDVLSEQVTETTRAVIESGALQDAAEQGLSIDDTAELLRLHFSDLRSWRAEAIARTETVGGFNASSRQVALSSGVVQGRRWMAAKDDRVRDSHRQLDGHRTVSMDDPYPNGLMHPGDPAGPARETVNCRCVEIYLMDGEE